MIMFNSVLYYGYEHESCDNNFYHSCNSINNCGKDEKYSVYDKIISSKFNYKTWFVAQE